MTMKDRRCDQCKKTERSNLSVPLDWSVMCINTHAVSGQVLSSALLCQGCTRKLRQAFITFDHAKAPPPPPHPSELVVTAEGEVYVS